MEEEIKSNKKDIYIISSSNISPKKKIITSYDKNNDAYYSELNSREPTTICQSVDYYELLKQQIKYYKELNSSLKEEIETVKHCKRLKELQKMDEINKLALSSNIKENDEMKKNEKLKLSDLKKENNIKMINTLDRYDKEITFSESKNSEEQYSIMKKEMERLEKENIYLKQNLEQLNNMKYPDEENNSILNTNTNIISKEKETNIENKNSIDFGNKLMIDNNRLKIYIEKIEQMQILLSRYESQINSLTEELNQKNEKMKILIYKSKSPNKNDKIDDSELVNIDLNNINNEKDENMIKQLDELNEVKKECERLKLENEKLNLELTKKNEMNESPIKKSDEEEKIINKLKEKIAEYENEINELKNKLKKENENIDDKDKELKEKMNELQEINEQNKNKIKDLEIKNEEANKNIEILNNQIELLKNQKSVI